MKNPLLWLMRAIPAPQPVTWENVFGSSVHLAGVSVNEQSALNHSPVWSGVSTLSRDIAKLPLVLYKSVGEDGKVRFTNHPLYRILHDNWNPEMTSFKARETMQALCLLYGNSYAEIVRDEARRVVGMYPVVPSRVAIVRNDRGQLRYRVTNPNGRQVEILPENMLHFSSLSLDGVLGESLTAHAGESIALGMATERFGASFFGNGSTFGGIVEVPGDMKQVAKDNTRSLIESVHQGVERAHKILILANGAKFTPRGTAPNEGQFNETRQFQVNEVARWLNMPPHKLGDLENAHFTNIEEQEIQYYVGCVSGWLEMQEQEYTRKLIAPLEYSQQSIEHVLEGVLRGDSTKRGAFYDTMIKLGVFSINDALRKENMNTIGPAGDQHFVPLNMVPIERYNEYFEKKLLAAPEPPVKALPEKPAESESERAALAELTAAVNGLITRDGERESCLERRALDAVAAHAQAVQAADVLRAQHEELTTTWQARFYDAQKETADERTAREAAEERLAEERGARAAAEAARDQGVRDAEDQAERVRDAEAKLHEAETRVLAASQESADIQATARAEVETARRALTENEDALRTLEQSRDAALRDAAVVTAKVAELETSLQQRKETEFDRLTRVVAAHRTLIVQAVHRLLRPEVDRARRRQATPESLRKWVSAFYVTHRDICADELYPAVLTHLAWKRSDEDPREVARSLAEAHCARSERELLAVIDSTDADEFHTTLERLLGRWEQERPQTVADGVLYDEVAYLRSLQ